MQILEKYRLNFNIDEDQDGTPLAHFKENIIDFQLFLKRAIPVLEIQKRQMKKMMTTRELQDASYSSIMTSLFRYEDNNVDYYSDSDITKRVLSHPDANDVKEQVDQTHRGLKNPFREVYMVLKGELLDLKGMADALAGRETVVKQQSACESKKRSDQQEVEKLSQGKTTLKSIFKSSKSKENDIVSLQSAIEVANKDIADYRKLITFLTIYHGQVAIQKFKKEKARQYLRLIHNMSVKEISNSHINATFWHGILELGQKQHV